MSPVQTPARLAAAELGQVRITGVLASHAELRMSSGDKPHGILFLQIEPAVGFPFEVRQDCGTDPARHIAAKAKEHQLRRGVPVTVYARGITSRTDHGRAVLKLEGVTDVIADTPPPPTATKES